MNDDTTRTHRQGRDRSLLGVLYFDDRLEPAMTDRYAAGQAYWRDPQAEPPPRATKILLLNPGGVAVIGHWAEWAIAWSPMPKIPPALKERMGP